MPDALTASGMVIAIGNCIFQSCPVTHRRDCPDEVGLGSGIIGRSNRGGFQDSALAKPERHFLVVQESD